MPSVVLMMNGDHCLHFLRAFWEDIGAGSGMARWKVGDDVFWCSVVVLMF